MKKIFLLLGFILLISFQGKSQKKELIYIRIQEVITGINMESYIRIAYPDHSTKFVPLIKLGKEGKDSELNAKKIQFEISTLLAEGYEIQSCSIGADYLLSSTVFLLTRTKEK